MWRAERVLSMEWRKVAVVGDVLLKSTTLSVQQGFEAEDLLLKLAAISYTKPRLLSFFVNTFSAISRTPTTRWLCAITFYFSIFAQLASISSPSIALYESG